MAKRDPNDYCSYTKTVEFLGDRWCLLIFRELAMQGPRGFNELVAGLPGRVSRSILTERLRRMEDLGVISRPGRRRGLHVPYQLTSAGRAFLPTVLALREWAEGWLPDDPAMVERDPTIVMAWLRERMLPAALPERQAVLDVTMRHEPPIRGWLILEAGRVPKACLEDPLLDESRYVYAEASVPPLMALARGHRDVADLIADGSIEVFGDPELIRQLPSWFPPAGLAPLAAPHAGEAAAPVPAAVG